MLTRSKIKIKIKSEDKIKCQKKFQQNKPHCNISTIGHVDHGKTTLTAAITKEVLSEAGGKSSTNFVAYDQIDKAPKKKKRDNNFNCSR